MSNTISCCYIIDTFHRSDGKKGQEKTHAICIYTKDTEQNIYLTEII
jgi:hypothetical protein